MLFTTIDFLLFFPLVVLVYFVLPERVKNGWLLAASYYFYMSWNPVYALLILICTFATYLAARVVDGQENERVRKVCFVGGLVVVFGILGYFKYTNFLVENINRAFGILHIGQTLPYFDIVLPVGISFFTFQAAGYLIDVYRGDIYAEKNVFRYMLFISFFPQLVAGPIERSRNLLKQLDRTYRFEEKRVRDGLIIMLWGYFLKMVIANRCAVIVDEVYGDYLNCTVAQLWLAAVLFSVQIYCDFMGYSTIAKGAGIVIGYRLMDNFAQPYFACSIKEFWRRWHISLSTWFRDYLYFPLGGSRCAKWKKYRNLMITFLISGLWHGADWTYVVWGGCHGMYQIAEDVLSPYAKRFWERFRMAGDDPFYLCLRRGWTFLLATAAWVFFRADSLEIAVRYLQRCVMVVGQNIGLFQLRSYFQGSRLVNVFLVAGILILVYHSHLAEKYGSVLIWLDKKSRALRYVVYWVLVLLVVLSTNLSNQEFVYFQF